MNLTFLNIVREPELRKKIMTTLGLVLIYRIGFHIPLPGVNVDVMRELADQGGFGLFELMSSLTGGALGQGVLFALGVMPYISASIIFSLLTKAVPALERLSKEGGAGQRKINQYTRLATIPICLVQSSFILLGPLQRSISSPTSGTVPLVYPEVWGIPYVIVVIIALTAGTVIIMWLGEQITEHGIGNGISIIIMAGIISQVPNAMIRFFTGGALSADESWQIMLMYLACWVLVVVVIVYITKGQRRIPIQAAKLARGRKVYGGQRTFLPFKVNQAGVMPIIFAGALMIVPGVLNRVPYLGFLDVFQTNSGFWYIVFYSAMIMFFAFFWVSMMFQPKEIADNLREHGSFIPGIRPGKKTAEFLKYIMTRITLAGSVFLCVIAVIPNIVTRKIGVNDPTFAYFMGGTSILIVVEVALDLVEQVNAHLVMKNYEGFMKADKAARAGWGRRST